MGKLTIKPLACFDASVIARQRDLAPDLPEPSGEGHLALVGGGPSLVANLDTLRSWPGEIWAINGVCRFLAEHGIASTFLTVDPDDEAGPPLAEGATRAIVAEHCGPKLFAALRTAEVFKIKLPFPGPTSAVAGTLISLRAGFSKVTLFGCESSYADTCHAYPHDGSPHVLRVLCGGETYRTKPEYMLQAEQLADVLRTFPQYFDEVGGGLTAALVRCPDYEVTHVSPSMLKTCIPVRPHEPARTP
jgi:hypothetical protein